MAKAYALKTGACNEDRHSVPERCVGEIFGGELYATPRSALPHAHVASVLGVELEILRLESERWAVPATHEGAATACAESSNAIDLALGTLSTGRHGGSP